MQRDEDQDLLIAVPTRNRPDTVVKSLESVKNLAQRAGIRVLVSDNSDVPSDALRAHCELCGFDYTHPPSVLSMTAHWAWILSNQEFKLVTMMTDRSYMFEDRYLEAVELARSTGRAVTFDAAIFTTRRPLGLDVWMVSSPPRSGRTYTLPCRTLLQSACEQLHEHAIPRLMNCVVHRSQVEEVRMRFPTFLDSASPDYEFAYKFLVAFEDEYVDYIDDNVFMTHTKSLSNSGGLMTSANSASTDFFRLYGKSKYEYSPDPGNLHPYSGVAHELNKVLAEVGRDPAINRGDLERQMARLAQTQSYSFKRRIKTFLVLAGLSDEQVVVIGRGGRLAAVKPGRIRSQPSRSTRYDQWNVADRNPSKSRAVQA